MRQSRQLWARVLVLGLTCVMVPTMATLGQQRDPAFDQVVGNPRGLPQLPPQGAWGEIINVTSRWIVIQNHTGQQYPIAINDIGEFLVRWPSSVDALGNRSMVEAVGQELGNNVLQTDHVDVFEGADQALVAPTYNSLLPNNAIVTTIDPGFQRLMSPWDYGGQMLLHGWAYPVSPMMTGIPTRMHVVGNAVNRSPLQLGILGNNIATVIAPPGGQFTVTRVTRGDVSHIKKGDYAFMLPQAITPRGLLVSQFVLYKTVPFEQFLRVR
ncbi:MAG: hypothetical protein ACLQGP_00615 [Isosphaeraceae bacterium]